VRAAAIALACSAALGGAGSRPAAAQEPRLFHVPTAYLAPEWGGRGGAGVGTQGDPWLEAATGILKIADLEVTLGDEVRKDGAVVPMPMAQFRMGVGEGRLAAGQPAVAIGFRRSLATVSNVDAAELWVAASRRIWQLTLHAGGDLWDATVRGGVVLHDRPLGEILRPLAGLEWRPPWYPRTTLLGEWSWIPQIDGAAIALRWLAGAGVRYQAFEWLSLDLATRFREGDKLGNAVVMLRINVAVAPLRGASW
jgi:hypothetical protein